jgi:glycosyltransferase involved in cell wall biosynthesis
MNGKPARVSIVVPAYNAERFIRDCIASLLAQSIGLDVIVVNDGSLDGTSSAVGEFASAVRLVELPQNRGLPSALNAGLRLARGSEYIGFLDSDDVSSADRIRLQLGILEAHNESSAAWGRTRISFISDDGLESESEAWPPRFYPALGSMLFPARVFDEVGTFDERLRHAQDIDFLARFREAGLTAVRHQDIVLTYRRHRSNMTNQVDLDHDYMATAVRRALHRRRARAGSRPAEG